MRADGGFVGREWAISRVRAWLADPRWSRHFLIVGPPGSGKSALAARLRERAEADGALGPLACCVLHRCDASDERSLDPIRFVTALAEALSARVPGFQEALLEEARFLPQVHVAGAVDVRGATIERSDVAGVRLTLQYWGSEARAAFSQLVATPLERVHEAGLAEPVLIIVDALDEAHTRGGSMTIDALLAIATDDARELPPIARFLLTCRPDRRILEHLPAPDLHLTEDEPEPGADVRAFLERGLAGLDGEARRRVGALVSGAAGTNFLVAEMELRAAQHDEASPLVGGTDDVSAASLPERYARYLAREVRPPDPEGRRRFDTVVGPLLAVLAAAQPPGFQSAQLAAICRLAPSNVAHTLDMVGQYLTRDAQGHWRVYHETFRDYLGTVVSVQEAHAAIVSAFLESCEGRWLEADEYARRNLVHHAAAAGRLTDLLERPGFHAVADPYPLWRALEANASLRASPQAAVYRRSARLFASRAPAERCAYLELAARVLSLPDLAADYAGVAADRPWRPLWARPFAGTEHRVLTRHEGGILSMALAVAAGGEVDRVVTTGADGSVRVHRADTGELLAHRENAHPGGALVVRAAQWTGRATWITGGAEGRVTVWDADASNQVASFDVGSAVTALAVAPEGDGAILAGTRAGELWTISPASGAQRAVQAHDGAVLALTCGVLDGVPVVLSGGGDGRLRSWRLRDGRPCEPEVVVSIDGWLNDTVLLTADDTALIGTAASDGVLRLRDSFDGRWQTSQHQPHAAAQNGYFGLGRVEGIPESRLEIRGSLVDGSFSVIHATGDTVTANTVAETLEAAADAQQLSPLEIATLAGRAMRGAEGHEPAVQLDLVRGGANAVDAQVVNGRPLAVSGGHDGHVAIVDVVGGTMDHARVLARPDSPISAVKLAHLRAGLGIVSAELGRSGTVRIWPLYRPEEVASFGDSDDMISGRRITAVALFGAPDERIVASAAAEGLIDLWDATTGSGVTTVQFHDGPITGIATVPFENRELLVVGSAATKRNPRVLVVWDPVEDKVVAQHLAPQPAVVDGIAAGSSGRFLAWGWGDARLNLSVWELQHRRLGKLKLSHVTEVPLPDPSDGFGLGWITRAAFGDADERVVVATDDRAVWRLPLDGGAPTLLTVAGAGLARSELWVGSYEGRPAAVTAPNGDYVWIEFEGGRDGRYELDATQNWDVTAIAVEPVATMVAVGGDDGVLRLWRDNRPVPTAIALDSRVEALAFTDRESLLVVTEAFLGVLRVDRVD